MLIGQSPAECYQWQSTAARQPEGRCVALIRETLFPIPHRALVKMKCPEWNTIPHRTLVKMKCPTLNPIPHRTLVKIECPTWNTRTLVKMKCPKLNPIPHRILVKSNLGHSQGREAGGCCWSLHPDKVNYISAGVYCVPNGTLFPIECTTLVQIPMSRVKSSALYRV